MQLTRDTSTLDLIFFDMAEYYEIPAILTPLSTSDHNVINWKSKCNIAEKENLTKIKVRQFQQQQLEQFDALLANYNWSSVFNTSGIDRKVNTFLKISENMISVCIFSGKDGQNLQQRQTFYDIKNKTLNS